MESRRFSVPAVRVRTGNHYQQGCDVMKYLSLTILILLSLTAAKETQCQGIRTGGNNMVFGDIKVREETSTASAPISLDILLYTEAGMLVSRQRVLSNGRYRFMNLTDGRYQIVVEVENNEVARFSVDFSSPLKAEMRQDIELQATNLARNKPGVVSATEDYHRPSKNEGLFNKAAEAVEKKQYDQATSIFRKIVENDPKDFPAWAELGRLYFVQKNYAEAEKAYTEALKLRPDYEIVLVSLGRLRIAQKNFDGAVEVLKEAVRIQPQSAHANYFLGEAYLQLKKGSIGVNYLYAALKIDPVGMADAHLLLAALYHGAGLREKAVVEYEEFLKKRPNYEDKKSLEKYIADNKKP